jgi:hypothetical protein
LYMFQSCVTPLYENVNVFKITLPSLRIIIADSV